MCRAHDGQGTVMFSSATIGRGVHSMVIACVPGSSVRLGCLYYRRWVCRTGLWTGQAHRVGPRMSQFRRNTGKSQDLVHAYDSWRTMRSWLGDLEIIGFVLIWFGWGSILISDISVYVLLCISHPICVCVAMIGYIVIREQMIWQVRQETLRLGAWASLGIFVHVLLFWFLR